MSAGYATTAAADVEALAARVREASERDQSFRIVGAGTWLDAGRPVRASAQLDMAPLTGVVEHVPGDLTITARAGTTLDALHRAADAHGQWLPLDPFGSDAGTIGATIATASMGPLATGFGGPRDQVLGVEFVTGDGAIVRGGGRVVKNVAGFDLVRLVTGAWGTIGAITEVTLRLRARPEEDVTLVAPVATDPESLQALGTALRSLPFTPYAAELLDGALSERLGVGARPVVAIRLGGSAAVVRAGRDAVQRAVGPALRGALDDAPTTLWAGLRGSDEGAVVRFSAPPSAFPGTWDEALYVAAHVPGALLCGAPIRGVVRAMLPADDGTLRPALTGRRASATCTRVYERLPAALWERLAPTAVSDRLSQGIKRAFDPHDVLNPGLLGR